MAAERHPGEPTPPRSDRSRADAARQRSPRPRVEVTVNEFSGTVSWRTVRPVASGGRSRDGAADARHGDGRDGRDVPPSRREHAAALRSAGLDPARARGRGAAPIPTHPAAVRAVAATPVAALPPEQLQGHLARVGRLRSQIAGDAARGAGMPVAVAARVRSVPVPGQVHALAAAHTKAAHTRAAHTQAASPAPGAGPRR